MSATKRSSALDAPVAAKCEQNADRRVFALSVCPRRVRSTPTVAHSARPVSRLGPALPKPWSPSPQGYPGRHRGLPCHDPNRRSDLSNASMPAFHHHAVADHHSRRGRPTPRGGRAAARQGPRRCHDGCWVGPVTGYTFLRRTSASHRCRLFRDRVQFCSGLVDLVVGIRRHGGGGHRFALAGE
jgi:hypothetical protein